MYAAKEAERYEMKTLIVLLVSDQTIPNVLFMKWFFREYPETAADILFVTTKDMNKKNKSECIRNALKSAAGYCVGNSEDIVVDENDISDTTQKLSAILAGSVQYDSYIVNITGGTKLMSLAVWSFFQERVTAKIFYQPVHSPLQQLYPDRHEYQVKELIGLQEYLTAYGISADYDNVCLRDWEYNKNVYHNLVEKNRTVINGLVILQNVPYFANKLKKKQVDFTRIDELQFADKDGRGIEGITRNSVCRILSDFSFDPAAVYHSDVKYITGGWFEEFVYQKLKRDNEIQDGKIALNVGITKNKVENELDVIYIDNGNSLHVVECKSFVDGATGSEVLSNAIYKLQAQTKSGFGLTAISELYTLSPITTQNQLQRAKDFGIILHDGTELLNNVCTENG